MRCLVTAGPTYEPLDEVRRLTNFSTGTLGCNLATALQHAGHSVQLLLGVQATATPPGPPVETWRFTSTQNLREHLAALAGEDVQAIFHAAAVSDFTWGKVCRRLTDGQLQEIHGAKIETRGAPLLAELLPTPKLLPLLRDWFPRAVIVGWKYELEGGPENALARAYRQLTEARTDACVLNGRAYGDGFSLLTPSAPPCHCPDAAALYAALLRLLEKAPPR